MNDTLGPLIVGLRIESGGVVGDGMEIGPGLLYRKLEEVPTFLSNITMHIYK